MITQTKRTHPATPAAINDEPTASSSELSFTWTRITPTMKTIV